jgi:hypothetical protein
MSKPVNTSEGTLVIPEADFYLWIQNYYLKPPVGTFVSWGAVKIKSPNMEIRYATSTEDQPAPPAEVTSRPA